MYPFTGLAQTCRENSIKDECPPNFVCSTNPFTRKKFCCSMEGGKKLFYDDVDDVILLILYFQMFQKQKIQN